MGTTENESAWSTTAATNANSDLGINWAEQQDAATVNNSARGMMAARAKARRDQGGQLTAAGTANALTVVTNQVLSSAHLAAGQRILVVATFDNTSTTVTLAPDGLTAHPIKRADGSALAIGSIQSNMALDLLYNAGSSEWRAANIAPATVAATSAAAVASFSAHKNAVDQVFAFTTYTKLTFTTEAFDAGSYYDAANSKWTPPAGKVLIIAHVMFDATFQTNNIWQLILYKNGTGLKNTTLTFNMDTVPASPRTSLELTVIDAPNGTDYYEVYAYHNGPTGTPRAMGDIANTYFSGTMI